MITALFPVVSFPASRPMITLFEVVVRALPASYPMMVFEAPEVIE